jgi:hypothetical protein
MTRRRKIFWAFILAFVAAVVAIIVHDRNVAGPVYRSAPLNVWLRLLREDSPQSTGQARQAIHNIGPAALPLIIEWLDWKDSMFRRALNAWVAGDPQHINFQPLNPADRRRLALEACDALGPAAQPAIPKLMEIATGPNPELDAPFIIARIGGSNALPALARIATSTNKFIRAGAEVSADLRKQSSPLLISSASPFEYRRQLEDYHVLVMRNVTSGKLPDATNAISLR